jgi:hypothetical protein
MPMEVALGCQDQITFLLFALGASVDLALHTSHQYTWRDEGKRTLLDFSHDAVMEIRNQIQIHDKASKEHVKSHDESSKEAHEEEKAVSRASFDVATWAEYWDALSAEIKQPAPKVSNHSGKWDESEAAKHRVKLTTQLEFWTEVVGLLEGKKAKTWNELNPDHKRKRERERSRSRRTHRHTHTETKPTLEYVRNRGGYHEWEAVPAHLVPLYNQLYQACWVGDNEKIREMCIPDELRTSDKPVLEVAVYLNASRSKYRSSTCFGITYDSRY